MVICKLTFENHCHKKKLRTGQRTRGPGQAFRSQKEGCKDDGGRGGETEDSTRLLFCMRANHFCPRVPCTAHQRKHNLQNPNSPSAEPLPQPWKNNTHTQPGTAFSILMGRKRTFPTHWAHCLQTDVTTARNRIAERNLSSAVTQMFAAISSTFGL